MNDITPLFAQHQQRVQKHRAIEEAIDSFSPDFMEAAELVAAVLGGLRARYDDNLGADCEHAFKELMDLLNELDNEWPTHVAERYEELLRGHRVNDEQG